MGVGDYPIPKLTKREGRVGCYERKDFVGPKALITESVDSQPSSEQYDTAEPKRETVLSYPSPKSTTPNGQMVFLDPAGTCLILVKRDAPVNPVPDNHGGVHHAFAIARDDYVAALDHLRAHGVEITFEEDRQGGVLNGPRAYFHDPDGTAADRDYRTLPRSDPDGFTRSCRSMRPYKQ
jgi:catechol 2,3-dioxygenase-like lactoylglutathione lyase family enzyme